MERLQEYNDFYRITKNYLRNYKSFKAAIVAIDAEIAELKRFIDSEDEVTVPISKYGDEPGGGHSELTAVEKAADKHLMAIRDIHLLKADKLQLVKMVNKVDKALNSLDREAKGIIEDYTIEGMSAYDVADKYHYSERWVRAKAAEATRKVAMTIFGKRQANVQTSFIFVDLL